MKKRRVSRNLKRKVRAAKSEIRYFKNLLEDMKIEQDEYLQEWSSDFSKIVSSLELESSLPSQNSEKQKLHSLSQSDRVLPSEDIACENLSSETPEIKKPDWAKKLYRSIAKASHPDRTGSQHNSEKMNKSFQDASKAFNDNDFDSLVDVALDLDISVNIPDKLLLEKIVKRMSRIKEKISEIEKSPEWIWGESIGMEDLRLKFLKTIIFYKFSVKVDDVKILNAIRDVENI